MSNGSRRVGGREDRTRTLTAVKQGGETANRRKVKQSTKQLFLEAKSKEINEMVNKNISSRVAGQKEKPEDSLAQTKASFDDESLSADIKSFFQEDSLFSFRDSKDKADVLKNLASIYFLQNFEDAGYEKNKNLMESTLNSISSINKEDHDFIPIYDTSIRHLDNMVKSIVEGAKEAFKYIEEDQLGDFIDKVNILMKEDYFQDHFTKSGISNQIVDNVKNLKQETIIGDLSRHLNKKDNPPPSQLYNKIFDFINKLDPKNKKVVDKLNRDIIKKQQKLDKANEKKGTIVKKLEELIKGCDKMESSVNKALNETFIKPKTPEKYGIGTPKVITRLKDLFYLKMIDLKHMKLKRKLKKIRRNQNLLQIKYAKLTGKKYIS